jgi:hypothetical protein
MPPVGAYVKRLQREQRAVDGVVPAPLELADSSPLLPERHGLLECPLGLDRLRRRLVGREPAQDERHAISLADGELRIRAHVAPLLLDRRAEQDGVGTGDRDERPLERPHPRHDRAVVEPQDELHAHVDASPDPFHDPYEIGVRLTGRHEVDEPDDAGIRLELALEDERVVAIAPRQRSKLAVRLDRPVPVLRRAEESGEERPRVEAGEAQPVDGAVAADERAGLEIADERVVLDQRHSCPSRSAEA